MNSKMASLVPTEVFAYCLSVQARQPASVSEYQGTQLLSEQLPVAGGVAIETPMVVD